MKCFVEGADRSQVSLFPEQLEDWISEDNPVRVIDVFVDDLISAAWALAGLRRGRPAGRAIILRFC